MYKHRRHNATVDQTQDRVSPSRANVLLNCWAFSQRVQL